MKGQKKLIGGLLQKLHAPKRSWPWRPSKRKRKKKKTQRFSYAISQIAPLLPVVALNRSVLNRKSQLDTLRFGTQFPKSHWPLSFSASELQRFKSQRLEGANATKSQTLAFYESQRFSATKIMARPDLFRKINYSGPKKR